MMTAFNSLIAISLSLALTQASLLSSSGNQGNQLDDRETYDQIVAKGAQYLVSIQNEEGTFGTVGGPGVVSLVTTALLRHDLGIDHPAVAAGLSHIESMVHEETGGIYAEDSLYQNYETCLAILCLTEANDDGRYDETIDAAETFVKNLQWGGPEFSVDESDMAFGGAGYGKHQRPDLSNTSFLVDALVATGNDEDSEAIQRALNFISRTQNFENAANTAPFATRNPDGGFYYTPAAGGQSQAGETENGGLRSYGSMTYVGLKSMIYAGVSKDDPRVQAALEWLQSNYRLNENPNMGAAGLYYYYHTFAKALDAMGEDTFVDADGTSHDWRRELVSELASRQQSSGAWVNTDNPRWLEDDAALVTGYALLALSYARLE